MEAHSIALDPTVWPGPIRDRVTGMGLFVTREGERIVLVDGNPDGTLAVSVSLVMAYEPSSILCCYPKRVRQRHPDLPILDDWDGRTWVVLARGAGRLLWGEVQEDR